ncbi:MAG: phage portal protein [Lactobacillus sp.]|nr:phage portal protein [Lactobacillus sp.]
MFGFRSKKTQERANPVSIVSTNNWQDLLTGNTYVSLADNPEVIAAVNTIAELVSNMSINLLENTDKGDKRVLNALSQLIDVQPAKGMTRKSWISKIVRDLYLYGDGNSICQIIVEPGADYLSELRPMDMSQITYVFEENKNKLTVRYKNKEYKTDQLVHFMINPDPVYPLIGTGYQSILKTLVDNLAQANRTKAQFFRGKYMPTIIIKVDADSEELASPEGREKIKQKYIDSDKSMEPWVIPSDMLEVQNVKPLTLKDIAINESVELDKKTVAAMFGVPPALLGVGNFSQAEYNNFVNTRIAGLGQVIAQTLTRDVLFKPEWFFRCNPRSLYQYNIKDLVAAGAEMVDRTAMGRNEWRGWVGLEPRDDMEELITLENYIPSSKLGAQDKLKGGDETDENGETDSADP